MDFTDVDVVMNYDAPFKVSTYIHRAGRTARAGRSGKTVTLVLGDEVKRFKAMLRKADNSFVSPILVSRAKMEGLTERFKVCVRLAGLSLAQACLKELKVVLNKEKWRQIDPLRALPVKSAVQESAFAMMRRRVEDNFFGASVDTK
jgi:superfamily II DNA/RNA helicase